MSFAPLIQIWRSQIKRLIELSRGQARDWLTHGHTHHTHTSWVKLHGAHFRTLIRLTWVTLQNSKQQQIGLYLFNDNKRPSGYINYQLSYTIWEAADSDCVTQYSLVSLNRFIDDMKIMNYSKVAGASIITSITWLPPASGSHHQ